MVSSVVDGFAEYREAARKGIEGAGGRAILVNEDFPSIADSSRNVCLDAVAASDVYAVIVGRRGGWKTPSGKLVVEEEFEEAARLRKPVLVFVDEDPERDAEAARLVERLSDYVKGRFRTRFSSAEDLREKVSTSLAPLINALAPATLPMAPTTLSKAMAERPKIQQVPSLRFALAPTRDGELIDPAELESGEFSQRVQEIGHSASVGLLNFRYATETKVSGDSLRLVSSDGRSEIAAVGVHESGLMTVETQLHRNPPGSDFGLAMVIAEEDIEDRLAAAFRFAGELYAWKDPFGRNQQFAFNCALLELGYHSIERNPQSRSSYSMPGRGNGPAIAYEQPRIVSIHDLSQPDEEVRRSLVKLKRSARGEG